MCLCGTNICRHIYLSISIYHKNYVKDSLLGEENIQAGEKLSGHLFHTNVVNISVENLHLDWKIDNVKVETVV